MAHMVVVKNTGPQNGHTVGSCWLGSPIKQVYLIGCLFSADLYPKP